MTLRGLLRSFPPLEVLQFLTQSGKTGTLRVYDESDTKLLAFEQGQLLYAIHQRKIPPLVELLIHRDLLSEQRLAVLPVSEKRWDDVVSRALERHRKLSRKHGLEEVRPGPERNRLGAILITQGRLTEEQLAAAMEPAAIPDKYLKAVLQDAGVIHALELMDSWVGPGVDTSLYATMIKNKVLTHKEICEAVSRISDESLAEILVYHGSLGRAEAKMCLDQLESLRQCIFPHIRLGEYMVAKGQITQRQLEKALSEQFASRELLGAILVEQEVLTEQELEETNQEIAALRADFGPLHPLRAELAERHGLHEEEFAAALQQHRESDRLLVDILAGLGKVSASQVRKSIETVLVRELCDVLIWPEASFEFYEGFSLNEALSHSELPVVHDELFDLGSLLLVACRDLDEFLSQGNRGLSPSKVFARTARARASSVAGVTPVGERRIVKRLDGRRDLRQVCRVLPGNRLSHFLLFAELTEQGEIEPLSRDEAYYTGNTSLAQGEYREALVLFKHALNSPGELPTNYVLRLSIQDARLASEKRILWRAVLRLRKLLPPLTRSAFEHGITRWVKRHSRAGNWLISAGKNTRKSCSHLLVQGRLNFENFLMRKGWARNIWTLKERVWRPIEKLLGRGSARAVVILGLSVAVLIVAMTQAVPGETPDSRPDLPNTSSRPVPLRSHMARYAVGVPVEMAPTVSGNRIYMVSRDGVIRCVSLSSASEGEERDLQLQWQVKVGEYGDILSRPTVADGRVFLTNMRGHAFALSFTGETLWRRTLPRLEAMQPTPLFSGSGDLVGIALVSRESVYVLDPDRGNVLYRLKTGNHIFARPVGNEDFLVVGSGDSHLYMARWKDSAVIWDHEVSDDITGLILHDNTPIFATRDGGLAAADPDTGEEQWRRAFRRNAIKSLNITGSGELYIETGRGKIEFILPGSGVTSSTFWPDPILGVSVAGVRDGQYFYASDSGFLGELELTGEPEWRTRETVEDITGWDHGGGFLAVTQRRGDLLIFYTRSRGANGR